MDQRSSSARDRSWLLGMVAAALLSGGAAAHTSADQGGKHDDDAEPTTSVACDPDPTSDSSTTTTTPGGAETTVPVDPASSTSAPPDSGGTAPAATSTTAAAATSTAADASSSTTTGAPTVPSSTTATDPGPTTSIAPEVPSAELPPTPIEDWPVRAITFPVAGPVTYYDDWGACRGGSSCPRRHIGNDVIAQRLQPLLAASDGVVTHLVLDHPTAGWGLVITDAEGWEYRYYHVNNDTPGTDDGADPVQWRLAPGVAEGATVTAGQVVGYVGDSGNSEMSVPHLHFEIHRPDGSPVDPYRSLRNSEWAARCSVAAPGLQRGSRLMPPVNPGLADAIVRTATGRGQFLLSVDGTVLALGDGTTVGWSRHVADDAPCPPAPPLPAPPAPGVPAPAP